MEVARVDLQ